MENNNLKRVLSNKDVLALAFGAMIGWGWVILTGVWIQKAGTLGAMIAFGISGIMIIFVGLAYAELTSALPHAGGATVFSYKALGSNGSFICTWALILGYVGVVAFEACAFPNVIEYIMPNFLQGHMYTIAGFDVYGSWVGIGVIISIIITMINYRGTKDSAFLQKILVVIIALAGIALVASAPITGHLSNSIPLLRHGWNGILTVTIATPFMFIGFDVIPQTAAEIDLPFDKIGKTIMVSIFMAVAWYVLIIFAVGYLMTDQQIRSSVLVTADAMKIGFGGSDLAAKILIVAGMAGIISSWNAFLIGGSRAMYALAQNKMLPGSLGKLHPKYNTPSNAILLIGSISTIAPFFGKSMMVWLVDAGSFGIVMAYAMVAMSFVALRKKHPDMNRPYKIKNHIFVGYTAIVLTVLMLLLYLPGMIFAEWTIVGIWVALGLVFYFSAKKKYSDFGTNIELSKITTPLISTVENCDSSFDSLTESVEVL
ncbi:APC family permease [Clostridium estertheticum]|uniref:APC family permease n=1 Tax=Clostridium estertheticum TaxID=238834 RepID=UPI0013E8FDB2|nr:APC family permease [Clostridium estertheticum]MBZ9685495.1 APC family permease [Clostridium estertheticum]